MWKLSAFIVSSLLLVTFALPIEQDANSKPIILEAVDIPTSASSAVELEDLKPTEASLSPDEPLASAASDEAKPAEVVQLVEIGPSESKPSDLTDSSSSSTISPTVTTLVETEPSTVPPLTPPRRQVHYDQRQDGKFNIRADLDNFVILVVPSNGLSILDLLKRSNQKPHHHKRNHHNKGHKKYYSKTASSSSSSKPQNDKTDKESTRLDYLRPESTDQSIARPIDGEFIEGRTPYHVDISSSEIAQLTSSSIADLPLSNNPSVVDATVFLPAQMKGNEYARNIDISTTLAIYPRHRKSLTNDDQSINTNSVLLTPIQNDNINNNNYQHAIINGDDNDNGNGNGNDNGYGGNDGKLVLNQTDQTVDQILTGPEFYSLNTMANIDPLALASVDTKKTATTNHGQLELTLLGAQEQCGPDRRRDSYGICQFVPQDYVT